MRLVLLSVLIFSQSLVAHEEHSHELKSKDSLPGTSVFHLNSEWSNQQGQKIKLSSLQGKPRFVVMLFTKCETACPLIVEDLKDTAKDLSGIKKAPVEVSIFSLDSFRETPKTLLEFSEKRKLPSHWGLFTSNSDAVAEFAAALGMRYKRLANGDFIHSNVIYYLNANGEVVAKKEGIKSPRKEFLSKIK